MRRGNAVMGMEDSAIGGAHDGIPPAALPKLTGTGENDGMTSLDPRRKRLLYVSQHRGTKETDLLLGGFAERHLADLDDGQLGRFAQLLEAPDGDLFDWITGRRRAPPPHDHDVMDLLIAFNANRPG
jgi:antitoxin CptB